MACPVGACFELEAAAVVESRLFWSFFLDAPIPYQFVYREFSSNCKYSLHFYGYRLKALSVTGIIKFM